VKRPEADSCSRVYWAPPEPASGDEPRSDEPAASFQQALSDLRSVFGEREPPARSGDQPWHLEIVCDQPGAEPRGGRPHHQLFIDARADGPGGDGSEPDPWLGIDSAVAGLAELHARGRLTLRRGQRIRLTHREMFTATSLEMRRRQYEWFARSGFAVITALLVLPVIFILGYLVIRAWPALTPSFILENPADRMTAGGIWAPLVGTFFLAIISLLIDAPIGILAAIYLNEYARDNWFTRMINLAVVNLAGVPSIVHGLFGVGAFVLFAGMGKSVLAASFTLAVMSLPVIITATREALAAVPMSFREACWNMGATRWQTIRTVVLPNSISGILTGVVFEIARTAGETAPILFTGVVFYTAEPFQGLHESTMALSYHLFTLSTQVRRVPEEMLYGTAVVLIGLVLTVNSVSIVLRARLRSRKKW
jgi:phosphate transport system permease protein